MTAPLTRPLKRRGRGNTPAVDPCCAECSFDHTADVRIRVLSRLLPATSTEIMGAYPCLLGDSTTLRRTLHAMGATLNGSEWQAPRESARSSSGGNVRPSA